MKIKRLGKILGIIAVAILLFFVIGIFALNSFLKSEKCKKLVIGKIETILKTPVELEHFRADIFSGVRLDGFSIKNPQGFTEGYFLKTDTITLKYNLYNLLRQKIKINEIQVIRPDIHLLQKADKTWNFPLMSADENTTTKEKPPIAAIFLLAKNVQIVEGNFTYAPLGKDKNFAIHNFGLKTKIHSINSFPNMNLNFSIDKIDSSIAPVIENINCSMNTSKGVVYLDNMSLRVSGGSVAIKGDTTLPSDNKTAEYTASISVKDIDLETIVSQFIPEAKNLLKGILAADITIKGEGLDAAADIKLTIPSLTVQDRIKIDQIKSNIHYSAFNFTIETLSMGIWGGSVAGKGTGTLVSPTFNVNFDISDIDAGAALTALGQDPSLAQGKLAGNVHATGDLAEIKADGKISSGKLNLKKMGDLTDIIAPFKATIIKQNKEISLEDFSAKIYGGSINGKANITFGKDGEPNFSTTLNLSSLEAKDALKQLTGKSFIAGKTEGNIKLAGKGGDINTFTGSTDFIFRDGKISSHPIQNLLALVLQMPALASINFVSAQLSSTIKDGKVNINTASVENPKLLRFYSKGEMKLSNQKLSLPSHLSLNRAVVEKMPLISEAFAKEDEKWCGIDFKISGTLSDPKNDLEGKLQKQVIRGVLEQLIDKENKKND